MTRFKLLASYFKSNLRLSRDLLVYCVQRIAPCAGCLQGVVQDVSFRTGSPKEPLPLPTHPPSSHMKLEALAVVFHVIAAFRFEPLPRDLWAIGMFQKSNK